MLSQTDGRRIPPLVVCPRWAEEREEKCYDGSKTEGIEEHGGKTIL